jgi:hypothetical protein
MSCSTRTVGRWSRVRLLVKFVPLVAVAILMSAPAARGASGYDFLFSTDHVTNDSQYFLNLAVSRYGASRAVLEPVLPRMQSLDRDLPTALFLADASGKAIDVIVGMRTSGLSWSAAFEKCGVGPDVLFAGLVRDPGPPYGKAWGYWKKNPTGRQYANRDITDLAQLQIGSRLTGVPVLEVASFRGSGTKVKTFVAEKKGRPYAKSKGQKGKDKSKSHGKSESHGH